MTKTKSESYRNGYEYGSKMNLDDVPSPPPSYSKEDLIDWYYGVDNAISDRLS